MLERAVGGGGAHLEAGDIGLAYSLEGSDGLAAHVQVREVLLAARHLEKNRALRLHRVRAIFGGGER